MRITMSQFVALSLLCCLSGADALAQKRYGPGVSDTEIRIGQSMPYSGALSAYGQIGRAQLAYFEMLNAKGGINGRKETAGFDLQYPMHAAPRSGACLSRPSSRAWRSWLRLHHPGSRVYAKRMLSMIQNANSSGGYGMTNSLTAWLESNGLGELAGLSGRTPRLGGAAALR